MIRSRFSGRSRWRAPRAWATALPIAATVGPPLASPTGALMPAPTGNARQDFYNQRYIGAHVLSPRFDEVMKLCGGNGYLATEPGDTAEAVHQAMQDDKPAVIHVKVDPEAVLSFRRDALQKRG